MSSKEQQLHEAVEIVKVRASTENLTTLLQEDKKIYELIASVLTLPGLQGLNPIDVLAHLRKDSNRVAFKPRARLLLQLGDQLIKNEGIALIELVKNSYDADASIVNIYMENPDNATHGVIIIEDDGFGMDFYTVENVWLEPGSDFKTERVNKLQTTPKFKRLPIGEKGIGRFGVHKLGSIIEMTSKKRDSNEVYIKINWNDFKDYRYLDEVPIYITEREHPLHFRNGNTGTNIVIRNLNKEWTRAAARTAQRSITALISPFEAKLDFKVNFEIMDHPSWLEGVLTWRDISHYALFQFSATLKGNRIIEFRYTFEPWPTMTKAKKRQLSTDDQFVAQFSLLKDDIGYPMDLENHKIGEVKIEGYIFDRDSFILKLGISDKLGFKSYLDSNGGVRVFRDGMRIYDYGEPENDWLGLDLRRVNQPSKRLSNNILVGAVYLSRANSSDLVEKTNREGFVENAAYHQFKSAILHVLEIVEVQRYRDKRQLRELYGPTAKSEPVLKIVADLKDFVERKVLDKEAKKEIFRYLFKIEEDYQRVTENLLKAAGAGLSLSVVVHEMEKIVLEIIKVLKKENTSERALKLVQHLSSLIDGYSDIIRKSTQTNENLGDLIDQAVFNTEYRLESHGISLTKGYVRQKNDQKVKLARSLVIGTIMNIIDNSIFWLEKSGQAKKEIFIGISQEEVGFINIIIADNGTGFLIPTEEAIEPFVSGKPGGMGLGLHIASEIMMASGGKLSFPDFGEFELPASFKHGAIIALGFKK